MNTVQESLKFKGTTSDIWSIREQLCLACSVLKFGDKSWMSVSRLLKLVAGKDIRRPDWFSQKYCAQQYEYLLENVATSKRKDRENGETATESIVRHLTQDRISELSKSLSDLQEEYYQLRRDISLLRSEIISDEELQKMWFIIQNEENKQEQKSEACLILLHEKSKIKELQLIQAENIQIIKQSINETLIENKDDIEISTPKEHKINEGMSSCLLNNLLKSPSLSREIETSTKTTTSGTITNLIYSSPKMSDNISIENMSTEFNQVVSNIPDIENEKPSAIIPSLSMLLEEPSIGPQKSTKLQNICTFITSKNLQDQDFSDIDSKISEISQITSHPIDQVLPKVIKMQMGKEEINEIIGDIEELIKEEISESPKCIDSLLKTNVNRDNDHMRAQAVNEHLSLSNSPVSNTSDIEIDSSTSNIAEIIGTEINNFKPTSDSKKIDENIVNDREHIDQLSNTSTQEFTTVQVIKSAREGIEEDIKECKINFQEKIGEIGNDSNSKRNTNNQKIIDLSHNKFIVSENVAKDSSIANEICTKIKEKSSALQITSKIANMYSERTIERVQQHEHNDEQIQNKILLNTKIFKNLQVKEKLMEESIVDKKLNDSECITDSINDGINRERIEKLERENNYTNMQEDSTILENKIGLYSKKVKEFTNIKDNKIKRTKMSCVIEATPDAEGDEVQHKKMLGNNIKSLNNQETLKDVDFAVTEAVNETEFSLNVQIKDNLKYEFSTKSYKNDEYKEIYRNNATDNYKNIEYQESYGINESNTEADELKTEVFPSVLKKELIEGVESTEELYEDEPSLSKVNCGKAMKTYSKKHNVAADSEPENETSGETADYRAWKKSIMLVYNRLATHKYASIFLRPITEDQAPGYHSIIFKPMDLWTIKKNIDNGTIRSTRHFQRDIMLMFQNAIMFNKHSTLVHRMTLEMEEESLQHMQVLVQAAGEASFKRETRTAASISNDVADNVMKRKWIHIGCNIHETENVRMKKSRKSEND